jgi:hypothetical protein
LIKRRSELTKHKFQIELQGQQSTSKAINMEENGWVAVEDNPNV